MLFELIVAGEINPDLILSGDVEPAFGQVEKLVSTATLTIGSSSAIFACAAARLGLRVAFCGVCGADVFGRYMLDEMSQRGIDIASVAIQPERQTGLSVILAKGSDRAILTHTGTMADLRAEDVPDDLLGKARHLHVASHFLQTALQPGLADLFRRAHSLGLTTSLDTNWDPSNQWRGVQELLPLTDIFLPNSNEALAITGSADLEQALEKLSHLSRIVVIKRGGEGALARWSEGIASARALQVELIDTVGAGDTFDAGFIHGFLNGWSIERALWLATACGSLSTRAAGGTAAQPTLEEALRYIQAEDEPRRAWGA
jgi:sugar/nucleoside kinase (ribokinase family)